MGWPADVAASAHLFVDPAAGLADTVDVGGEKGPPLGPGARPRQCRGAGLRVVEELRPLRELAGHPAVVVAEQGGEAAAALGPPPGGELLVVVGPEGGLTGAEVEKLAPWARLGLGPYV